MTEKKDRIKAWATSIAVHLVLLLVLALLTISAATPDENDDGVPVLLEEEEELQRLAADEGNTNEAMAEDDQGEGGSTENDPSERNIEPEPVAPNVSQKVKPATKPDPKPTKSIISQKNEQSLEVEEAAKRAKKAREAEARKKAEEAAIAARKAEEEARRLEEAHKAEQARQAAASKVSGAFGKASASGNGSSSTGSGSGASGLGNGEGGVSGNASVGNRKPITLPAPTYADATSEGVIVVAITVSPSGTVTSATIKSNNTNSVPLRDAAIAAAKKARFSEGSATENGTITYRFKQR